MKFMNHTEMSRLIPPALKSGDTIGVVAPAGPFDGKLLDAGVRELEKMGFRVFIPNDLLHGRHVCDDYLFGSDAQRAAMVEKLFESSDIDAIMCARGGYGSLRILPRLNYDTIRKNPKIFIGFSDVTALLMVLAEKCGLVTFHGPMVTTISNTKTASIEQLFDLLTLSKNICLSCNPQRSRAIKSGKAYGKLCGGNLATLCHLIGTPFEPNFKECIVFIEEINEPLYKIDRMLFQMKLAGCFEHIRGLVLGSFKTCGEYELIYDMVEHVFQDIDIPILTGLDVGHCKQNYTIPVGLNAVMDTYQRTLTFQQAAVSDTNNLLD